MRRLSDGTMRTVVAQSERGAMTKFFTTFLGADKGEDFDIKLRGSAWNPWTTYRFYGAGSFRKINS